MIICSLSRSRMSSSHYIPKKCLFFMSDVIYLFIYKIVCKFLVEIYFRSWTLARQEQPKYLEVWIETLARKTSLYSLWHEEFLRRLSVNLKCYDFTVVSSRIYARMMVVWPTVKGERVGKVTDPGYPTGWEGSFWRIFTEIDRDRSPEWSIWEAF